MEHNIAGKDFGINLLAQVFAQKLPSQCIFWNAML